jgi:hypothetical protein
VKPSAPHFRIYLPWLLLFLLLLIRATVDTGLLFRYPIAVGVDGYYYVLQVTQLAKTGQPYFSTHFPAQLYVLTVVTRLTGNPITAIKAVGILLQIILATGVFAIIRSVVRNTWLALLGSALAVIPQSRLYFTTEYINQLGALVLLVWAGWTAIRMAETRRGIALLIVSALLVGAFFSHKSALIFVPTLAVCCLLVFVLTRSAIGKKFAVLATMILWLGPAIISAQPFFTLPAWLQPQLSSRPRSPFEPSLLAEELMLAIAALALLFLIVWLAPRTRTRGFNIVFGSIALWSLLVTLNPFFNAQAMLSSVAGRSRVFSYIQVALLVPALIWLVSSVKREAAIYVCAVFIPLLILSAVAPLPYGLRPEFLTRRGELIQSLKIHSSEVAPNSIIVAPHGDQFVVTATIGIPSQQRPPESSNYGTVYWLLNDVKGQSLTSDAIVLIRNGDVATILVDDTVLKRSLSAMGESDRLPLLRSNAHLAKSVAHVQSGLKPE